MKPCAREVSSDTDFQQITEVIWADRNPATGNPFTGTPQIGTLMAEELLLMVSLLLTVWPVMSTAAGEIVFPAA